MRRLDRNLSPRPPNWDDRVERSLPTPAEFRKQATAFQKLGINSPKRRKGFAAFAPHVPVPALWGRHKEVIAAMSAHKCAYCEGPINALRASHVEHFKPKSPFSFTDL